LQRALASVSLLTFFLMAGFTGLVAAQEAHALAGLPVETSAGYYQALMGVMTGNQQEYGGLFTTLQGQWFRRAFLVIVTAFPSLFLLHFVVIGAKRFSPGGQPVFFFPLFARVVHWVVAAGFSLLVITGLMIVFGAFFGGGTLIRTARYMHLGLAAIMVVPAILMFLMWLKDMLPERHDLAWMGILGGYLSKAKRPVPAGKFNAGQKMHFWFTVVGGGVMAVTGYFLWGMGAALDFVRLSAIVHNVLGIGLVALYLTHVYMSVFAVGGSLESMKTGYKSQEEVDILHSRYKY